MWLYIAYSSGDTNRRFAIPCWIRSQQAAVAEKVRLSPV
jgi:hypothetical protein